MNSRNVASASSSSSNMDKKRINRERTAKEIAAEETEKKMKEEARADIAARVAAETKAKLLEAENAKKELEEAQRKVAEAEENAYAAKAGVSQAAARTEMALRAAEQALINEEGHTLTNLQPEATLSDTALRNIALGVNGTGGAGGATKKDLAPTPLIDKEDEYGFNPAAAGEPTPALLFDNNNNLKTNTTKNGVFNIRRKSSRNTNDDGRSIKSGRSRASRASQASSGASLGTAVSYSTAGSESEFGDVSDGKGGTKKIRKNGDTIGWSRTETRLLMALVDEEARNAQSTPGGFMWDAVATALRKRLKEDLTIAARGKPQRRKAIDCRRRWDHVLKKAHSTPTHKLTAEQKQWMVAYQSQKSMMGIGGGMKSKNSRKVIESIPEDQEVSGSGREIV
jgi:hypothetical protein